MFSFWFLFFWEVKQKLAILVKKTVCAMEQEKKGLFFCEWVSFFLSLKKFPFLLLNKKLQFFFSLSFHFSSVKKGAIWKTRKKKHFFLFSSQEAKREKKGEKRKRKKEGCPKEQKRGEGRGEILFFSSTLFFWWFGCFFFSKSLLPWKNTKNTKGHEKNKKKEAGGFFHKIPFFFLSFLFSLPGWSCQ